MRVIFAKALFYLLVVLSLIFFLPVLLLPRDWGRVFTAFFIRFLLEVLSVVGGLKFRVIGEENLPKEPSIFAVKHQSAWETFALMALLPRPLPVMKEELLRVPLLGLFFRRMGCIAVNRDAGKEAQDKLIKEASDWIGLGYNIVIFPEGTRTSPGDEPRYKPGVIQLYRQLSVPLSPIGLNAGHYWTRHAGFEKSGLITVCVASAIPSGLPRAEAYRLMQERIEQASDFPYTP